MAPTPKKAPDRQFWSAATLHREVSKFMDTHNLDRTVSVNVLMDLLEAEIVAAATGRPGAVPTPPLEFGQADPDQG